MNYVWDFSSVWAALPYLLEGLELTIFITVISMTTGLILGTLVSLARLSHNRWLRLSAQAYTEFIRDTPFLLHLMFVYYSLAILTGIALSSFVSAWIALTINLGAFIAEIIRAGIQSIVKGQSDAAQGLGMTNGQVIRRVILPQAFRRVIPPLGSMWVSLFKDTSIVSIITVKELMYQANVLSVRTYRPVEIYTVVAIIYFVITLPQARIVDRLYAKTRVRE